MELEIRDLVKNYDEKEVLKDINFTFRQGKIYGLLGRNGSGKTTFFNCINKDVPINKGKILLDNKAIDINDIGYVISSPVVPEFLTGKEFLQFFLDINEEKIKDKKTISEYFDIVKINEKDQNTLLKEYSHGMKNKMQILINIILNPKVILLDEPLTSLDVVVQEDMKNLFKSLKKDHIIIFSTHILELALDLCDEIVVLRNKEIVVIDDKKTSKYKERIIEELEKDE